MVLVISKQIKTNKKICKYIYKYRVLVLHCMKISRFRGRVKKTAKLKCTKKSKTDSVSKDTISNHASYYFVLNFFWTAKLKRREMQFCPKKTRN